MTGVKDDALACPLICLNHSFALLFGVRANCGTNVHTQHIRSKSTDREILCVMYAMLIYFSFLFCYTGNNGSKNTFYAFLYTFVLDSKNSSRNVNTYTHTHQLQHNNNSNNSIHFIYNDARTHCFHCDWIRINWITLYVFVCASIYRHEPSMVTHNMLQCIYLMHEIAAIIV